MLYVSQHNYKTRYNRFISRFVAGRNFSFAQETYSKSNLSKEASLLKAI